MLRALSLFFLVLSGPVSAGPDRLSLLLASKHVGTHRDFNERNPGVFMTWEDRALGLDYSVGVYHNSFGNVSIATTAALSLFEVGSLDLSLFAGAAYYPGDGEEFLYHAGDLVPLAGLQVRRDPFFLQVMPGGGDPEAIVSFGLTFDLSP